MKHERLIGDPVAMLIADTRAEAREDERRALYQPLAYRFCGYVAAAIALYAAAQLVRAGALSIGWAL